MFVVVLFLLGPAVTHKNNPLYVRSCVWLYGSKDGHACVHAEVSMPSTAEQKKEQTNHTNSQLNTNLRKYRKGRYRMPCECMAGGRLSDLSVGNAS